MTSPDRAERPAADRSLATARPTHGEWAGLAVFACVALAFGVLVELRAVYQESSKTDFGVYARAAWAVRTGQDAYTVTDNNGWHYCYPPAFAILMAPLADPYPWESRSGYLPYALAVAIWFVFGVACVAYAAHTFARAVLPGDVRGSRRWWYARTVPVLVCLGGIGFTLARGQVNVLVVALIAGMFSAAIAGRTLTSGAWLAAAVALKVIPGYLFLFPLFRRDGRAFVGAALGGLLLFGVLPAAVWGVNGAIANNRKVLELVLKPGATGGGDQTRAKELTNTTSTDSQSFAAAIHALLHPDPLTRPVMASPATKRAHWAIGGVLTLVTLFVGWRRLTDTPADALLFLGSLCVLMLLLSPVSHMHYYALAFPLVAGLWLKGLAEWPENVLADRFTTIALAAWGLLTALPLLPGPTFDRLREAGFAPVVTLGLWAFALNRIGVRTRKAKPRPTRSEQPEQSHHSLQPQLAGSRLR